jgi:hypothetical protein
MVGSGYAGRSSPRRNESADLAKLKHRDVLVIFVRSFGTVALDEPLYRAHLAPALARFEATLERRGRSLSTASSPSFGGGSWVSHGTLLGGIKLDQFLRASCSKAGARPCPLHVGGGLSDGRRRTRDQERHHGRRVLGFR